MKLKDVVNITSVNKSSNNELFSDQDSEVERSGKESVEDDEDPLDASATDSDKDESELEDNNEEQKNGIKQSKSEKVKEAICQRYQERHGKQLYIRFPHKIPEIQEELDQKVKELTPLAIKAHKPRQRHVRFCLIDFSTKEDRDAALNTLKKAIRKGDMEKFAVSIPRTENLDFVQELAERKIKSIENKKAKLRLKRASKKAVKENNFTSTVVVLNLPKSASSLQVRDLFPNAVDINIKAGKGKGKDTSFAAVTFPTTLDARNAIKKKVSLGGNQLRIKFDNKKFIKKAKSKNSASDETRPQPEPTREEAKLKPDLGAAKRKVPPKTSKRKSVDTVAIKCPKLGKFIDDSVRNISTNASAKKRVVKQTNKFKIKAKSE